MIFSMRDDYEQLALFLRLARNIFEKALKIENEAITEEFLRLLQYAIEMQSDINVKVLNLKFLNDVIEKLLEVSK